MNEQVRQFDFIMIKPSHYDDDGYPIVWWRTILPSNSLAALNGLARHAAERQVLGPDVSFNLVPIDECNRHVIPARIIRDIMAETEAVAARLGIELPISIDQRMAGAEKVGAHKTSMLQDLEAGRPMELEAVVGAVLELGDRLGVPMPATRTVYGCAAMLNERRSRA